MKDKYYWLILGKYQKKESDFSGLFQAILSIGDEIRLERALGYLERWLEEKLEKMERTRRWLTKRIRKW